ncbi:hypothetical protein BJ878DRAFT_540147 [Calycina marina]|uniref:Uncharacterized protein n=1 Tax=Calycina marina TaxID=1763456 RepID=A0A9P8CGT9_9HELO|nr:hypothetical protein BJ878DRAFT_540147 [Calycina marina]
MSPVLAPPTQVLENVPVGHTALTALMHLYHRPLLTLRVAPLVGGLSVKSAVPVSAVVDVGAPPHLVMTPAISPQMASCATFASAILIFVGMMLRQKRRGHTMADEDRGGVGACGVGDGIEVDGRAGTSHHICVLSWDAQTRRAKTLVEHSKMVAVMFEASISAVIF